MLILPAWARATIGDGSVGGLVPRIRLAATSCKVAGQRVAALGVVLAVALTTPAAAHSLKDFESKLMARETYVQMTDKPAPDFVLQDADGRTVSLSDFKGQVVVLNFIYAGCPDICPLQSHRIAQIQETVNGSPMRDAVAFVSITTDPKNDTAEVLKDYGDPLGLDSFNWVFLTSGPEELAATRKIAAQYGLKFVLVEGEYQVHALITYVIDKSGTMRAKYFGLKFDPANLIDQVDALAKDDH